MDQAERATDPRFVQGNADQGRVPGGRYGQLRDHTRPAAGLRHAHWPGSALDAEVMNQLRRYAAMAN